MQNDQHTPLRRHAHANQVEDYTKSIPDLIGGRFPIERPVALSGRPVLTRSARALCTAERPAFGPAHPSAAISGKNLQSAESRRGSARGRVVPKTSVERLD